jgi:hypothetical protein
MVGALSARVTKGATTEHVALAASCCGVAEVVASEAEGGLRATVTTAVKPSAQSVASMAAKPVRSRTAVDAEPGSAASEIKKAGQTAAAFAQTMLVSDHVSAGAGQPGAEALSTGPKAVLTTSFVRSEA